MWEFPHTLKMYKINNSIEFLKTHEPGLLTKNEITQLKELGPPRPDMNGMISTKTKGNKNYYIYFDVSIYRKYDWMGGCSTTKSLYCYKCMLTGNKLGVWCTSGVRDLNHLTISTVVKNIGKSKKI